MDERKKLSIEHLSKAFFTKDKIHLVLNDISLDVKPNEFLVLLGPGQCGKSVLLNTVAGLMQPTKGEVYIDGELSKGVNPKVSFVFQQMGLFNWKTAIENVALKNTFAGMAKKLRDESASRHLQMVELSGFENYFPATISGGMKQRVGIARAYDANPEILLMDEPFGALDAQTRYSMQAEILRIWEQDRKTILFVTNNIEEAVYLGDRIVLLSKRPTSVKQVYDLSHLPRPRSYVSPEFLAVRQAISDNMDLVL